MKYNLLITTLLYAFIMMSCNGGSDPEKQLLASKLDSISRINEQNTRDLAEVNSIVNVISNELDSISAMEDMIHFNPLGNEGRRPTRSEIRDRLRAFSQMLDRQKKRITLLQDSLSSINNNTVVKYRNLITLLNNQLEEKDNTINNLMAELNKKNANISKLQEDIDRLSEEKKEVSAFVETQKEALTVQDNLINEGFIKIGTKKELQKDGLMTDGGLFSKAKVNNANIEAELFEKVDIREVTEINIQAKSFKILTPVPEPSYLIEKIDREKSIIRIKDPTQFWSISRYLIIQIK